MPPLRLLYLVLFSTSTLVFFSLSYRPLPTVLGSTTNLSSTVLISLTNLARTQANLHPLTPNSQLNQAALLKAQDMLRFGYWQHQSVTDREPWYFLDQAGYAYHFAGENLARDFSDSDQVVQAWLNSPSHRANLLNPQYTEIGLAVVTGTYPNDRPTTITVQLLATPPTTATTFIIPQFRSSSVLNYTSPAPSSTFLYLYLFISCLFLILFTFFPHPRRSPHLSLDLWSH